MPCGVQDGTHGVHIHLQYSEGICGHKTLRLESLAHLYTKVKVVFGTSRHDPMETVHSVRNAELGAEQRIDLPGIRQVCFDRQ